MIGLETVFGVNHPLYGRIFYDAAEGSYYDLATDLYLTLPEVAALGLPV